MRVLVIRRGQNNGENGGDITFGLAEEPDTLEAYMQNGTHGRTVKLALARGLYNYNEDGELQL